MLTNSQQMMISDFTGRQGYGRLLIGWKGRSEIFKDASGPPTSLGPLDPDVANTFVEQSYFLLMTLRPINLYRGFETAGLQAPYGRDHPSYILNLLTQRKPGRPDGRWWTSRRPSASIDDLKLPDLHRGEDRDGAAVTREWNRLDFYIEGELPIGSHVYVGRAAPQQESALYGGQRYSGGAIQFRLPESPDRMLRNFKQHAAA
jgi:hypothetical protein